MEENSFTEVSILGVRVDNISFQETLRKIEDAIRKGERFSIVTPNADHLVKANRDPEFRKNLNWASLSLPDSAPIIVASWLLGKRLKERVPGSDLTRVLCLRTASCGYSVFFLGAAPGVAMIAKANLEARIPGVRISGCYSPSRQEVLDETDRLASIVNRVDANIVIVGFGAPLQEKWIHQNFDRLNANIVMGVGSSIDYLAGTQRRAPKWMYKVGLEWLYRMLQDPRRLLVRYLVEDLIFFPLLARQVWRTRIAARTKRLQ